MSFFPGKDPERGDAFARDAIQTLIVPRFGTCSIFRAGRPSAMI